MYTISDLQARVARLRAADERRQAGVPEQKTAPDAERLRAEALSMRNAEDEWAHGILEERD